MSLQLILWSKQEIRSLVLFFKLNSTGNKFNLNAFKHLKLDCSLPCPWVRVFFGMQFVQGNDNARYESVKSSVIVS